MVLDDGTLLTSSAPTAFTPSVELCHETGAYCEAFKRGRGITASLCLHREEDDRFLVLSPCGVCLERLAVHGPEVLIGVPSAADSAEIAWVPLREALPFYWRRAIPGLTPGW